VSWIWYWAILARESEGFIASVPDLWGPRGIWRERKGGGGSRRGTGVRVSQSTRGERQAHARQPSEMPSDVQLKIGRAMISVKVG
jgi:hypothetical protein